MNFPVLMKKLEKKRRYFLTGRYAKEEYAHDEERYQELLKKNYAPEDFFEKGSLFTNIDK